MSFRALRLLAWTSVAAIAAFGATRPRYGGSLRIATPELPQLETSHLVVERLIRLDRAGYARAWLAESWQHDTEFKTWRFRLRPQVQFHDGSPLTASVVSSLLESGLKLDCAPAGQTVIVRSDAPVPGLLALLASADAGIARRSDDGVLVGTGPFRVETVEPGRRAVITAFEGYWGGRPYLDKVEFSLPPPRPSYQPSAADVWRLPVNISAKALPDSIRVWSSEPRDLIALDMGHAGTPLREAVALSIDRESIVNVITQRRGEAAYSLLPGWMTGYAFLLRSSPDAARARQIASTLHPGVLEIAAPTGDVVARLVAERIIVNAREAGLVLRLANDASADLRVVRVHIGWKDPRTAVAAVISELTRSRQAPPANLEGAYALERDAVADRRIVPIVFVPEVYAISPRVRNWNEAQRPRDGVLHLEDVWVEP